MMEIWLYTVFTRTVWADPKSVSIVWKRALLVENPFQIKIFFLFGFLAIAAFSGLLRFAASFLASLIGPLSFEEK